MTGRRTIQVLVVLGGLIAWAVQFTIIYGVTSTLCGRGWADATFLGLGFVQAMILATTLVMLAATALLFLTLLRTRQQGDPSVSATDGFLNHAGILINGFSLVVILWHGIPAFILPACS